PIFLPLPSNSRLTALNSPLLDYAMNYWKNNGAPAEKLMVGFVAYAQTFTLTNPSDHGLDAPTSSPGTAGPYTQEAGSLAYFEVCGFLKGATEVWNAPREVPYAYKGNQWIGYDNPKSFTIKVGSASFPIQFEVEAGVAFYHSSICATFFYPSLNCFKSLFFLFLFFPWS
uniref:GH18 domain-containing protein n=1 Tax=Vombatus ursinus TaxID=29139 RepID=A0A4X2KRC4_VOMUR